MAKEKEVNKMASITWKQLEELEPEFLYQMDDEASIYPDYSGRFMFGKSCIGITHAPGAQFQAISALVEALEMFGHDEVAEQIKRSNPSQDSMGLDQISYWEWLEIEGINDSDSE